MTASGPVEASDALRAELAFCRFVAAMPGADRLMLETIAAEAIASARQTLSFEVIDTILEEMHEAS